MVDISLWIYLYIYFFSFQRCVVEARYNPNFLVTKEDIDALLSKVELLRDITKRISEVKIGLKSKSRLVKFR